MCVRKGKGIEHDLHGIPVNVVNTGLCEVNGAYKAREHEAMPKLKRESQNEALTAQEVQATENPHRAHIGPCV